MAKSDTTAQKWKEKGDEEFNKGNWSEALIQYTDAIKLVTEDNTEKAIYYDKRAATYFELRDYDKTIEDCNSVEKIYYKLFSMSKFRRFLALIELERFEEASQDMKMILCYSDNTMSQFLPTQFHEISHKIKKKVLQMMGLAFNVSVDKEKRENAMINLLRLASWRTDAFEMFKKKVGKDDKVICSAIRIVDELCQNNISQTEPTMINVVLPWCLEMINSKSTERVNASQYCLQNILNKYSGMNDESSSKPDKDLCKEHKKEIDTILSCLLNSVESKTITGLARDAIIELITRNIHYTALDWAKQLVEFDGLRKLMEVASQLEEYDNQYESLFDITSSTRTIISMSLAKIWKNMDCNDDKGTFVNAIDKFIRDKLLTSDTESKLRGIVAITTLICGPFQVADEIIFKEGMIESIFAMAETDDVLQQKVVFECVFAGMTKYNEVNAFIDEGVKILRKLYQSKDDVIRIQAFVGFCKWSRFKSGYISEPFEGEAMDELFKVCGRLLINPKKEKNITEWAIKGLSYLTFDGNVKDELIKDQQIIQTVFELAKISDQSVLYSVATTLVNLCNAYGRLGSTFIPEMEKSMRLLKFYFLKEYLANEINKDLVQERRCLLVKNGVTGALVSLAKTGNHNCKELTASVFSAICGKQELREIVVQQGGTEALLSLALNGTDKGKKIASQVLVRLTLTIDLEVAFSGDLMMNVVQPITNLLNPECSVDERCEALTALYNLACVDDTMRLHIFNDSGFENFNNYMSNNHNMMNCAYAKLINNLVLCYKVAIKYVEQRYYQLGYLMCWSMASNEDERTKKAAAETLAILTTVSEEACEKLLRSNLWPMFLHILLNNPDNDLQRQGIEIALNMMKSTEDVAAELIKADIMEPLKELSENDTMENKEIKELASLVLEAAAKWDKTEGNVEGNESSDSTDNIEHVD